MTDSGKLLVLNFIIKQTKPFKAVQLYTTIGISRSLANYHLTELVAKGLITKAGMYYTVKELEDLVDMLTDAGSNRVVGLLGKGYILMDEEKRNDINYLVEHAVAMKSIKAPGHQASIRNQTIEIEKTIDALKGLRRYLNSKEFSPKKATGMIGDAWNAFKDTLQGEGVTEAKWIEFLSEMEAKYPQT